MEELEEHFECPVCGNKTKKEDYPCSNVCFEADMM